jgi:hypothetical protein
MISTYSKSRPQQLQIDSQLGQRPTLKLRFLTCYLYSGIAWLSTRKTQTLRFASSNPETRPNKPRRPIPDVRCPYSFWIIIIIIIMAFIALTHSSTAMVLSYRAPSLGPWPHRTLEHWVLHGARRHGGPFTLSAHNELGASSICLRSKVMAPCPPIGQIWSLEIPNLSNLSNAFSHIRLFCPQGTIDPGLKEPIWWTSFAMGTCLEDDLKKLMTDRAHIESIPSP